MVINKYLRSEINNIKNVEIRTANFAKRGQVLIEPPFRISNATIIAKSPTKFGAFSYISEGTRVHMVDKIGRYCSIANNVIFQNGTHGTSLLSTSPVFTGELNKLLLLEDPLLIPNIDWQSSIKSELKGSLDKTNNIIVENDVWIGTGAIILRGVTIGTGAIIGAGSVVTKDVLPYSIVAGVPAKVIRMRFEEKQIEKMLKSKWWEYEPKILENTSFLKIDDCLEIIEERKADGFKFYNPDLIEIDLN